MSGRRKPIPVPGQLALLPWAASIPPPANRCRRCGRPLRAPLARRYGLGERCHLRSLAAVTAGEDAPGWAA